MSLAARDAHRAATLARLRKQHRLAQITAAELLAAERDARNEQTDDIDDYIVE